MVLNALAWAPPGTAVTLESATDAGGASILVRDQGPGVATAQASHIFDGASTRHGGAGVGLKHARAIARAAGGDLELVNDGSPGASFRVRWRRAEPPPAPLSAPRAAVLAGTRVLIVEDDVDVATLLESALGARGAQVVVARTAAELDVRALEEHDAALVDLSPIAHDVRGAVQALRRGSPDAVLVFISGSATGLPDELAGEAVRWVRKPFEVGEIVAALLGSGGPRGSEPPAPSPLIHCGGAPHVCSARFRSRMQPHRWAKPARPAGVSRFPGEECLRIVRPHWPWAVSIGAVNNHRGLNRS